MTQKVIDKMLIAAMVLAAAFPAPGAAIKTTAAALTAAPENFSVAYGRTVAVARVGELAAAGNQIRVSAVASQATGAVVTVGAQANLMCQSSAPAAGTLGAGLLGAGSVNLNVPANCFNLSLARVQPLAADLNLQVRPLAAAPIKILAANGNGWWLQRLWPQGAGSLPALAVAVAGILAMWAFDKKKPQLKNKQAGNSGAAVNLFPSRLQILRC